MRRSPQPNAPGQLTLGLLDDPDGIRASLVVRLRESRRDAHLIAEMGILHGAARIDLASIDADLDGFEIKSDRDDLRRLPAQFAAYGQVFDHLTLVTVERHFDSAEPIVPAWCGIEVVGADGRLTTARAPSLNPDREPMSIARLLWRDEVQSALDDRLECRGRARRTELCRLLTDLVPFDELRAIVRQSIRARSSWRVAS